MSWQGNAAAKNKLQGRVKTLRAEIVNAYDIAVKNGFEGTEEEWLASLVGPEGPEGPAGVTPKKGVDYFTEEDREVLVQDVKENDVVVASGWSANAVLTTDDQGNVCCGRLNENHIFMIMVDTADMNARIDFSATEMKTIDLTAYMDDEGQNTVFNTQTLVGIQAMDTDGEEVIAPMFTKVVTSAKSERTGVMTTPDGKRIFAFRLYTQDDHVLLEYGPGSASSDILEAIPVKVAEDGYTDISGLRQATNIEFMRSGDIVQVTVTLEGGESYVSRVTLDDWDQPVSIVTDGVECKLNWSGF